MLGEWVRRSEDLRLLTGRALFVDDVDLPDMLHCAFVRSPHAHARILRIDVSNASRCEGVFAIYTAADLGAYLQPAPLLVHPPPIEGAVFHSRTHLPLAKDKVRHVGEPIAVVVAVDRYVAEDAAAEVVVEYEPLQAVVDIEQALSAGQPRVHEDLADNLSSRARQTKGDYAAAAKDAHLGRQATLHLRPRRLVSDGDARRHRPLESPRRAADGVGHHAGAGHHPGRAGRHAGTERAPGAGGGAVHRRWLRPQDDDVLSGGDADPLDQR